MNELEKLINEYKEIYKQFAYGFMPHWAFAKLQELTQKIKEAKGDRDGKQSVEIRGTGSCKEV